MFNIDEIDKIKRKIPILEEKIRLHNLKTYEPTRTEIDTVSKEIHKFIIQKKRIVYGGWAQNAFIKKKDSKQQFYDESQVPDIEFYTPDPTGDLMDLADLLHEKGYKYIHTEEGVHNETYKIFVNFINYTDISYLPLNIFNNVPVEIIDGMKMAHPHFMLIDAYRVYTDPINSFWRLDKTFSRFNVLDNLYPFYDEDLVSNNFSINFKKKPTKFLKGKEHYQVHEWIRKKLIHKSKLVVIGYYGYQYYLKKTDIDKLFAFFPYYQVISIDYKKDVSEIYKELVKKYKNKITFKEFFKFSQFYDTNIMFYFDNNPIFQIFGHNERCTVYRYSKKKQTYFGTIQLILKYFLIAYNYAIINRTKNEKSFRILFSNLIFARKSYLENKTLGVMDDTAFKGFTIKCFGDTIDTIRKSRLNQDKRSKQGKTRKFNYDPKGKQAKRPVMRYENTSGNEIINKKYHTIKNLV